MDLDNNDVVYLTAEEEDGELIAQGNAPLNPDGTFIRDVVHCRLAAAADSLCFSQPHSFLGA